MKQRKQVMSFTVDPDLCLKWKKLKKKKKVNLSKRVGKFLLKEYKNEVKK